MPKNRASKEMKQQNLIEVKEKLKIYCCFWDFNTPLSVIGIPSKQKNKIINQLDLIDIYITVVGWGQLSAFRGCLPSVVCALFSPSSKLHITVGD